MLASMSTQHPNPNGQTSVSGGRSLPPTSVVNAAGSGDEYVVCWVLVPSVRKGGRRIEPEHIDAISEMLEIWFGRLNDFGECLGWWDGRREQSIRLEIAVQIAQLKELEHFIRAISLRLGQRVMCVVRSTGAALFIDIDD